MSSESGLIAVGVLLGFSNYDKKNKREKRKTFLRMLEYIAFHCHTISMRVKLFKFDNIICNTFIYGL